MECFTDTPNLLNILVDMHSFVMLRMNSGLSICVHRCICIVYKYTHQIKVTYGI